MLNEVFKRAEEKEIKIDVTERFKVQLCNLGHIGRQLCLLCSVLLPVSTGSDNAYM